MVASCPFCFEGTGHCLFSDGIGAPSVQQQLADLYQWRDRHYAGAGYFREYAGARFFARPSGSGEGCGDEVYPGKASGQNRSGGVCRGEFYAVSPDDRPGGAGESDAGCSQRYDWRRYGHRVGTGECRQPTERQSR